MAKPLVVPFVTEDAYVDWSGGRRQTLFEPERLEGPPPIVFPSRDEAFYGVAPLSEGFPAVTVTTLRDVVVRGKSNILAPPEGNVRHGLVDVGVDILPEVFYGRLALTEDRSAAAWAPADPFAVGYLPEAASFVDSLAYNYAHWMTEVLPRIAAFRSDPRRSAVPLIVDADLHANIERSLSLVVGPDATIVRLRPEELVRVGTLHNTSPTGYVPFKLRPQAVETIGHGRFGSRALRQSVKRLRDGADGAAFAGAERPKLVLRRKSAMRHISNEADIEAALEARGFTSVDPDRLTLDEQVRVFSRARMVVGATGAAMTNLIFCPPDCPVVVQIPRFRQTAVWYWRRMSAAAGAGPVVHVSGDQVAPLADPFAALAAHADFQVELADVLAAVDAAEALSG